MILKELVSYLDKMFQIDLAAEWDRVGLQVGSVNKEVKRVLITLDVDDELIEEAIKSKADLVISHHPVLFETIESVTDSTAAGRRLLKLIENNIAVYSAHTNYDIMDDGLNDIIVQKLELSDVKSISYHEKKLYKFVIFVPTGSQDTVRKAVCSSGGGRLGDYSCCTFISKGKGTFLPGKDAQPYIGKTGELNVVDEVRMECIVSEEDLEELVEAALKAHPYEEPAYDIYKMENSLKIGGLVRYGELKNPVTFNEFLKVSRRRLEADDIGWMHRGFENTGNRIVEKVAVAAGSSNSLTEELSALDCDVVVTGEISYHNGITISESGKIVAVMGHGTIEKFAIDGMYNRLSDHVHENELDLEIIKSNSGYWTWRYDIGRR